MTCSCGLALFLALLPSALLAADGDRTVVRLEIKRGIPAWSGQSIDFSQSRDERVIAAPGSSRSGKAPGATVLAEPIAGQAGAYRLTIGGSIGEPVTATVTPGEPARFEMPRRAGVLPYQISLSSITGADKLSHETMGWNADYRAEGTLTIGSCHALLAVWDMTADGVFNRRDFTQGSAVGVDLNGDGEFGGREEFITGGEVFQFCGKAFYVDPDSLEPDGSAVTIVETSAEKPKVGNRIPSLVLNTTDGDTIHSESWKGKVTVLDFWASWCGYCIAGFPILKEMQTSFSPGLGIVSINTDEPSGVAAARKVLAENALPWPKVMSGQGLSDPVWGMFRAMEERSLPLYVAMDRDGVIRYSGGGGDGLVELRAAVQGLIASQTRPVGNLPHGLQM
jgi:thiol-disulfide isomerase/thioredoxin